MANETNILNLDTYLQKGTKTIFYTYVVISCAGFLIDIFNFNHVSNRIFLNNSVTIGVTLVCFSLYLLKKLNLKTSFGIVLYLALGNVIVDTFSDLFSAFRIDFFFRDSLFLICALTLASFVINKIHAIVILIIYAITAICLAALTQNAFLKSSIYIIILFASVYAVVVYYIVGVIEKSILEREKNIRIIEANNEIVNETNTILEERQQKIEEQAEELTRQTEALQEQSDELALKNSELARSNRTKDLFLSIMAHDLKNPFHAILGFSEILETRFNKLDDTKKVQYIHIINTTSQKAYNLLENLLQWARAQSNTIEYNPAKVDLNGLIKENLNLFLETHRIKRISMTEKMDVNCLAYVDENMFNTVIRNLLSNAIKFTPPGGSITVVCEKEKSSVIVKIIDTGIGIEKDDMKNLFRIDKIYSSPGTDGETGTGLGLVLCKDFIEKNGGTIHVASKKNMGTKITLMLPAIHED